MSLIDLGGPGCVRLNYLSPEEGIALNVSYGDNLLHSETVKGPDPAPTCLKIFSKLAQMCARFSELLPTDDGLRGCMQLEPMLLGEVQIELPLGCFRMGPNGMKMIESTKDVIKETSPAEETTEKEIDKKTEEKISTEKPEEENQITDEEEEEEILGGFNTKEIIAAVNQSAEEGIAILTNWLGLAVNTLNKSNSTLTEDETSSNNKTEITSTEKNSEK